MGETLIEFSIDAGSEPTAAPEPRVGTIYEVGIDGKGYMLYDNRQGEPFQYRRALVPLEANRFATGETPFSEAVERYSFIGWSEFSDGAGQTLRDRTYSSPAAFRSSKGVDPFDRGGLRLLRSMSKVVSSTYAGIQCRVTDDRLYAITGASQITYVTGIAGTPTAVNLTHDGADPVVGVYLETDGQRWYLAAGADGILRGTTADPGAKWSLIQGEVLGWHANRLCVALKAGSSTTPNRFTTLADDGTEEVVGGHIDLPAGWEITGFAGGSGYVWFGARSGDRGVIYKWDLTNTPSVALELPAGEWPRKLFWYQGQVMIRAGKDSAAGGSQALIYRALVSDDGNLSPELITTLGDAETAQEHANGSFTASGRFVLFSDPYRTGGSGTGAIDLATGGWAQWVATTSSLPTRCMNQWQNRTSVVVVGDGVWLEQDAFVTEGHLVTSIADGASSLDKVFDEISAITQPLPLGTSVTVELTFDDGESYLPALTLDQTGQRRGSADVNERATTVGVRITLEGPGTTTPVVQMVQARMHQIGMVDEILQLPVDCSDYIRGLNSAELDENGPGKGVERLSLLRSLTQSRVLVQDIDWHLTGVAEIWELQGVDTVKWSLYDTSQGSQAVRAVAVLTLRRKVG